MMKKPTFFYGYIIVAASFAIQWTCLGTLFTYGVFFKLILAEFELSRATVSGASSLAFLMLGFMGIFVGRMNDRFGPRIIIVLSGLFLGGGYLLMSLLHASWQLYLFYGVIVGTGMASNDIVTLSTIARWFVAKRGMMTGIAKVGTGAGQFMVPLIVTALIAAYGWRTSYLIIGASVLVLYILLAQLFRRDPQQMGLAPDNAKWNLHEQNERGEQGLTLHEAIRTRQFWTLSFAYFCVIFGLLTIVVHIVQHATDVGLSRPVAAGVLSAIGAVSMVGRFTMGRASDKIGCRRAIIICFVILISSFLWLLMVQKLWMFYLFSIIYGFAHGGFYTLASPMTAELFGTKAHGSLLGIVQFAFTLGGAVGPLLAGYIFDLTGSYYLDFWGCTAVALIGLVLMVSLKQTNLVSAGRDASA
jgi:MFS family permease